jgi:ABC-type branched-subunit amino acid transport system substrate-binding protein
MRRSKDSLLNVFIPLHIGLAFVLALGIGMGLRGRESERTVEAVSPVTAAAGTLAPESSVVQAAPGSEAKKPSGAGNGVKVAGKESAQTWKKTGVLKIGSIVSQSGPTNLSMAEEATRAYFQMVNESGGIHGLKLELISYDDGFDATTGMVRARRLVEQDGVFAIVGWMAPQTEVSAISYFEKQGVPVIGGINYPETVASRVGFPLGPNKGRAMAGVAPIICRFNPGKVQGVVIDASFADQLMDAVAKQFEKGCPTATLVGIEKVSAANPDYTPNVLRWRSNGAQSILAMLDIGSYTRMFQAIGRQAWKPQTFTFAFTDREATAAVADYLEGTVDIGGQLVPWVHPNHPGVKRWATTVHKYYPNSRLGNYSEGSWTSAQMFVEALKLAGPDFTREKVIQALEQSVELRPDVGGPMRFRPGDHDGARCVEVVRWKGSDWVEAYGSWQCWDYTSDGGARLAPSVPMGD